MIQSEISQFSNKWLVEKMMEHLEILSSSMPNGLASNAVLVTAYLLISLNVFYAHKIALLAIWHETTHASN